MAEARGKREDKDLELCFLRAVSNGTYYVSADRFRKIKFTLKFAEKAMNVIGNQMADLIVYPIARHVLDPTKPNLPYEAIAAKKYQGPGGVWGLKVFPL